MLKALELSGFKSFADRTRFEFPRGISVIVGPNGSGKSNLVDAVKWVLGSQSAKSLRGKEMTDVIFNGCASRAPLGTGEATLTLENGDGRLPIDAKEVHVTRRVYRSGEGEYLINRQPCRLRDIRDLLAGTGITTEAYCIIEQGKVDALLQSSPRERRIIFEEAAGISQFKAKKTAAMRRLERVEQNLLRLSDIVDEVESRVRSVRMQAGKARRYRECATRLQHLRTQVGLADWQALTKQIASRDAQLADLRRRADERLASLERAESAARDLERQLEAAIQRMREIEAAASSTREQIAARQAEVESQRTRRVDLQQEVARIRHQLAAMSTRAGTAGEQFRDATSQLRAAEAELTAADAGWREQVERVDQSQRELDEARAALDQVRVRLAESLHAGTLLGNQVAALASQLASARASKEQCRQQLGELAGQCESQVATVASHERTETELAAQAQLQQVALGTAEQRLTQVRSELDRADKQHRQLEARLTRTRERIAVLSELEHRLEGLDGGVQEVLRIARDAPEGPFSDVCGIVADLFHVDVDTAPLIEVALGERAQFIVVASASRLLERLEREPLGVAGRVGFLGLDRRAPATALDHMDLSTEPGVMGRADRFIETASEHMPLVKRLLGRTWLVDRLSTALRLWQTTGRGLEFVTSDGEFLSADGTLVVGPRLAAAGVLSRRSELRACHEQVAELERHLAQQAMMHARLDHERAEQESRLTSSIAAYTELTGKLADCHQKTAASRWQLDRVTYEHGRINEELRIIDGRTAATISDLEACQRKLAVAEGDAAQLQTQLEACRSQLVAIQQRHVQFQAEATGRQIVAAKCEQRVEMLHHQMEQAERNQQERDRALSEARLRLAARQSQFAELDETMLAGRQVLAELFLHKEQHVEELARQTAADEALRRERARLSEQIRSERQQHGLLQAQRHKLEVATGRLRHERQTLCERMQDDYGIDLAAAAGEDVSAAGTLGDRGSVEREIADLRDQINSIGAVNLDALDELEQLESRFGALSSQYRDLVEAKASLERIIHRINVDSRQLFLTTLELIRGHFQDFFRRLFGGGEADILIDEAEDVLECGIEIVGRPPGKEACSISLLSGGEKTLTCVALLLAVFRSKPSPFCVLDEVDAALDEANIGRFIGVLREFLSFTQFVVVTHSKKTMSGADTLYGVTMEESGVSKRVSVRFEDVSEDGQILPSALAASRQHGSDGAAAPEQATPQRRAA